MTGDAALSRAIAQIEAVLGGETPRLCHDYKAPGRDSFQWQTTIHAERTSNVHIADGVSEESFVEMRVRRDSTLPPPKLLRPAIRANMRAGRLPPLDEDGARHPEPPNRR